MVLLLAACAPAPEAPILAPTLGLPTNTPEPAAIPAPSIPESITRYESILRQEGLSIAVVGSEVHVVNRDNEPVMTSAEASTITIQTEDGETLTFPEEALEIQQTIALGLENVLTIRDHEGNTQYFYLEKTGLWATPIEQFKDAQDIENYPVIRPEDVWSGRTLTSTALEAEPFPPGTLVPDEFAYMLWQGALKHVIIQDFVNGGLDTQLGYWETVNQTNDYRRYDIAYYRAVTAQGVEIILGTQQVLTPDGVTSIFPTEGFGPEWSWVEGIRFSSGRISNVVNSVFSARDPLRDRNIYSPNTLRPVITWTPQPEPFENKGFGNIQGPTAPDSAIIWLYLNESQNNPLSLRPDLRRLADERIANPLGQIDYLAPVGQNELTQLQYMILIGTAATGLGRTYFQSP